MSLTLTRPLVTPVVESRPRPRRWPSAAATVQPSDPLQPALDLRPAGDPVVRIAVLDAVELPPGLPDARTWSVALALRVLEVLAGRRPLSQLSRWVEEEVLDALAGRLPHRRPGSPAAPPALRSVRVQHLGATVAEVAVHGRLGERSVAAALRLEARRGRWLCTALEVGPPR